MKPAITDQLSETRDFHELTEAVLALCEPFGPVHSFRMIHNRGAGRVACFIELESPKQQMPLARELGAKLLNGAVCLDVPVLRGFGCATEEAGRFRPAAAQDGMQASP
jgi:hypothetical protein